MTRKQQTGRTGYDTNVNTYPHPQSHSLHGFIQSALGTSGVSLESDRKIHHEKVARRAFELYEQSGCQPSRCKQNWAQAEQDLKAKEKEISG